MIVRAFALLALALSACTAGPSADLAPADEGGFHPPALDPSRSMVVELHIDNYRDFTRDLAAHGIAVAAAFCSIEGAPCSSAKGRCEIYLRASDIRPPRWAELGATLHHELAHCEGWPADHPAWERVRSTAR
jgi:hypothetical protein